MPEIAPKVQRNLKDRFEAVKDLVKNEVGVFRGVFQDFKGRLGKDAKEPTMGKEYGVPTAGKRGGLTGTVLAIPIATVDVVEEFLQKQGDISRRWIR